jgi:RecB family endonuclease NucS
MGNMVETYSLEKTGLTWNFKSETELENFIWFNLTRLFKLIPLERQYYAEGLYCDLLAVATNQQLVILELKISQDRYIVQQLTRYFHYLKNSHHLNNVVDFELPVKLIGIMPNIHQDNLIDIQYHRLDFELYEYQIEALENKFYFKCSNVLNDYKLPKLEIITSKEEEDTDLPPPPSKLKPILNKSNESEYKGILASRSQILRFDKRIKEKTEASNIIYCFNKSNLVAEIRYDNQRKQPILFLWLPLTNINCNTISARMRIWTDWHTVSNVGYIRKGNGNMISSAEYNTFPIELIPAKLLPFTKYRGTSRKFDPDNFFPDEQQIYDKFVKDRDYQQTFMKNRILMYAIKDTWTINKHGYPLATPITNYFDILREIYEGQEKRDRELGHSRLSQLKISHNIKNYNKKDYLLPEVIEFALQEKFLRLK